MAEPIHIGAPLEPAPANSLPDWMANASTRFGVIGDAWKVTPQSSIVRGIQFAPGTGWSDGILTTFDETNVPQPLGLPVSSQARWHMIVSRVDWQNPLTRTFVAIEGGANQALPVNSPNFYREPGVRADWPVALVMVPQNSMNVSTIIDLRLWRGDNGWLMAKSELVKQYLTRPGTVVEVDGKLHRLGWDSNGFPLWEIVGQTGDTGWNQTDGASPFPAPWWGRSGDFLRWRKEGNRVQLNIKFSRNQGTLENFTNGNIGNTHIATLPPAATPKKYAPLNGGVYGPLTSGYVETDGKVYFTATAPGETIQPGRTYDLHGFYFTD